MKRSSRVKKFGIHTVISQAKAYKTRAVIIIKMTMEPNKTATSFKKMAAVIVGSFVAL